MSPLALAAAGLLFPGPVILAGLVVALRRHRPPVPLRTAALFLGLGLGTVVLGELWDMLATRWLLGRMSAGWAFNFYYAVLTAALPEEGFRYLAVRWGLARRHHRGVRAAMLLGGLTGLAFGVFEHVGYAVAKGWEVWLARSFTSVPYHTLSGAVLGGCVALAARTGRPWGLAGLAVLVAVHGLADWHPQGPGGKLPETPWEEFVASGWVGNIVSLVAVGFLAAVLARRARAAETADPPATGAAPQ